MSGIRIFFCLFMISFAAPSTFGPIAALGFMFAFSHGRQIDDRRLGIH